MTLKKNTDKRGSPLPRLAAALENIKANLVNEADVKKGVEDRLQYEQNLGHLLYLRLNSGEFIEVRGQTRRRIKGCPAGTADFVVFQGSVQSLPICHVTFLEIKSGKGKQSPEQKAFEILAKMFDCRYFIVRDADEIEEILL